MGLSSTCASPCSDNAYTTMRDSSRVCSITDALAIVGDRYALLVAREIRYGNTRFGEIAAATGAPRDVLTARLRKLEAAGIVERRPYSDRPLRHEYVLTEAGNELHLVLHPLRAIKPV